MSLGPAPPDAAARRGRPDRRARRSAEAAYALWFAGIFLCLGAQLAFHSVWLEGRGLSAETIGWINAAAMGVRVVAGAGLPALSDALGQPRWFAPALTAVGAAAAAAHFLVASPAALFLLSALMAAAFSGLIPLSDARGWTAAERLGFSYRRARSVGSAAFLTATLVSGLLVDAYGLDVVILWMAAAFVLAGVGAGAAPDPAAGRAQTIGEAAREGAARAGSGAASAAAAEAASPAAPRFWAASRGLLKSADFRLLMLVVAAIQASHAVFYVYAGVHYAGLGYSGAVIGALWAWAVASEIALFAVGGAVMARMGARRALALAGAVAAVRWAITAFDPPLGLLFAAQTLHAGSFALTHLATLAYIGSRIGAERSATAQGLVTAAAGGVGMALATVIAAQLYPALGAGAFWLGVMFGVIGVLGARRLAPPPEAGAAA